MKSNHQVWVKLLRSTTQNNMAEDINIRSCVYEPWSNNKWDWLYKQKLMKIWHCRSLMKNVDSSGIWTRTFGIQVRALPVELYKLTSNPCGLDSSRDRAADRYPEGASSNPARVNIFKLTSAVSDYHQKFLFTYISKDDSETGCIIVPLLVQKSESRDYEFLGLNIRSPTDSQLNLLSSNGPTIFEDLVVSAKFWSFLTTRRP